MSLQGTLEHENAIYCINKPLDDSMRSNVIKHRKIYFYLIIVEFY
jgi:hypothetical protein